jgi:hypothetical protein
VPAAAGGRVVLAGPLGIYGGDLDHGLGLFTLYGHLSQMAVAPGAQVARGDTIGKTGETGLQAGDHLHFSVMIHGVHVDPVEWWDGHWIRIRRAPPRGLPRATAAVWPRGEAEATLARLGLDPGALRGGRTPAADLTPRLAGPDAPALVAALGELATPEVATLLVALEAAAPGRAVRKEIRRALYRLRQRGVPVPVAAPTPRPAPRPAEAAIEGLVSPMDGRGDRVVWLVRALPAGGVLLVAAQLNEPAGLVDVHAVEIGRKGLKTARQRLEREAGVRLVAADWRTLDALVVEAHERVGEGERARERDYLRLRPRLTADPPGAPAEPVSTRATPSGPEAEAAPPARRRCSRAGFRTVAAPEALTPFAEEIAAARASPLVVSRLAQEDRLREILARAAETLVPPPVMARRLEAMAYVLAETGRPAAARQALAAARALRAHPARDAINVPVVAAYVERALGTLLADATQRETEERRGSLVVTPAEYLRARASSHPPRTRA